MAYVPWASSMIRRSFGVAQVALALCARVTAAEGGPLDLGRVHAMAQVHDAPEARGGDTVGAALLRVHRSYLRACQALIAADAVSGLAHVPGGGLEGNTRRILPDGRTLDVDWAAWERPALFRLIQDLGGVPEDDMRRTFNCGLGLVAVVPEAKLSAARRVLETLGEQPVVIGTVR